METTVNQRIEVIRQNIGLNQREFAQLLDIDEATYSKYKKGTLIPGSTVLDKIVKNVKNISIKWLFYGINDESDSQQLNEPPQPNYTKSNIMNEKMQIEMLINLSENYRTLKDRVNDLESRLSAIEPTSKKKHDAG